MSRQVTLVVCGLALVGCRTELFLDLPVRDASSERPARVVDASAPNLRQIVAGWDHVCVLSDEGVRCWGDNAQGQLGLPADELRRAEGDPARVPGLPDAIQGVFAGAFGTCAITARGDAWCWGDGEPVPRRVEGLSVRDLCVGNGFLCALTVEGEVRCWGANLHGQLGRSERLPRAAPTAVPEVGRASAIACGAQHACALREDGGVRCWGANEDGQAGAPQLFDQPTPVQVEGVTDVTSVRLGMRHGCAATRLGRVSCWGRNQWGELGDGTNVQRSRAATVQVAGEQGACAGDLTLRTAPFLALGGEHSCALFPTGAVVCWGRNICGALGDGEARPARSCVEPRRPVVGLPPAEQVSCGRDFCCALGQDREVYCWGRVAGAAPCAGATFVARRVPLRGPR